MKNTKTTFGKCFFIVIITFGSIYCAYSQDDNDAKSSLNIYVNNAYEQIENRYVSDFDSLVFMKRLRLGYVSIAYESYFDNGNSHEFELMPFSMNYSHDVGFEAYRDNPKKYLYGYKSIFYETYFRYQYNWNFLNNFYIGISTSLIYDYFKGEQNIYYTLPEHVEHDISMSFSIIPGYKTKLYKELYFTFNIPVKIFEIEYFKRKALPPLFGNLHGTGLEYILFPKKYYLRLGLKYNF
ncbi:MAG: hypothetical protein U9R54_08515 [Bacteroidota bacterium]|nr:hypothetical protein [Bacteroidota bacterium]